MNEFETFEYVIVPKKTSKTKMKKAGFILLYVLFIVAWFIFGLSTPFPALLALIPLTTWILVFFTWRYTNTEYEYSVTSGIITFSNIYGGRSRKKVFELDLRDIEQLIKISDHNIDRILDDFEPTAERDFRASADSGDGYLALFTADDTKYAVYLDIIPKMMKSCKLYCQHGVMK